MACCGGQPWRGDIQELLKQLRDVSFEDLVLNKKKPKLKFNANEGEWKDVSDNDKNKEMIREENIKNLERIKEQKIKELEELDKEYLAKAIRLLYMAQTHCEIKKENDELFDQYDLKKGNKFPKDLNPI